MKSGDVYLGVIQRDLGWCREHTVNIQHGRLRHRDEASFSITYRHLGPHEVQFPAVLDGYVLGVLMMALGGANRLIVNGRLSSLALHNFSSIGEAWHAWLPEQYRPIEVVADEVIPFIDSPQPKMRKEAVNAAISGFSGGVDSTFTLLRHAEKLVGSGSFDLADVCMVHGFDVQLEKKEDFNGLVKRTAPLLDSLGVRLHVVETDVKTQTMTDWEHSYGAQLASVLHLFSSEFHFGLIASADSDFLRPQIPFGSNAILDHFFSGSAMQMFHDGAGFSRSDKVRLIAKRPIARSTLKVCYRSSKQDTNCGQCFKCVRTQLIFAANGVRHLEAFETEITSEKVRRIVPEGGQSVEKLQSMWDFASSFGRAEDELFVALDERIQELREVPEDIRDAGVQTFASPESLSSRMAAFEQSFDTFLKNLGPLALLDSIPGNIGDHLIWAGTVRFLEKLRMKFSRISLQDLMSGRVKSEATTLLIPGNAALTADWHEWLPNAVVEASNQFDRVVILPSEYDSGVPAVAEAISKVNVFCFSRESVSFHHAKSLGWAAPGLDLALWGIEQQVANIPQNMGEELGKFLLALRTDKSSLLPRAGLTPAPENIDISATSDSLESFVRAINEKDTVITDRLHVAVAGIMLGKNVRFLDPANHKISRYMESTISQEMSDSVRQIDIDWLIERDLVLPKENPR